MRPLISLVTSAASCFHRDIAPDNVILLGASQQPLLLDFGAARRVIGDMTQALTVILKPGYAPVEQYAEAPNMKQGGWTDVYALAASVHFAIMGRTPPTSVGRLMSDSYVPLAESAAGRYSPKFLQAIDRALRVRPEDRTASIADLRADLGLGGAASAQPESLRSHLDAPTQISAHAATATATAPAPAPVAKSGKAVWLGLGALLLAAAGGGVYVLSGQEKGQDPALAEPAVVKPALALPTPTPALTTAAAASLAPSQAFEQILQAQTAGFKVTATSAKQQFRIGKDPLAFTVESARDGFVNVLMLGQDGALLLLFPNAQAPDNRIKAGRPLALPQNSWPLETAEPPGPQQFLVIVSAQPRDYSALSKERDEMFLKLPTGEQAAALTQALKANGQLTTSYLLGLGRACSASNCDDFGAAQFAVEVVR
ncbi:DUF4384 domain-containing protein [Roseateles sp.]|uniref:DUF4384 domain-containing protein n=1 Tax=Roseateles sp. TaxID=1971397 RepID=UPI00286C9D96|nr:DUF4384 domain-containing protein [Roseateles sp.]